MDTTKYLYHISAYPVETDNAYVCSIELLGHPTVDDDSTYINDHLLEFVTCNLRVHYGVLPVTNNPFTTRYIVKAETVVHIHYILFGEIDSNPLTFAKNLRCNI